MKTFACKDTFKISGRGTIKIVHVPNPNRVLNPEGLPREGEIVLIDEKQYRVYGVEVLKKLMNPPFISEDVGLLIRENHL